MCIRDSSYAVRGDLLGSGLGVRGAEQGHPVATPGELARNPLDVHLGATAMGVPGVAPVEEKYVPGTGGRRVHNHLYSRVAFAIGHNMGSLADSAMANQEQHCVRH